MKPFSRAVILLIDHDQNIRITGKPFFNRIIDDTVKKRRAFVKMKSMRCVDDGQISVRTAFSRKPSEQTAHRRMTVNDLNGKGADQEQQLAQSLLIFLDEKRRSGDFNRM